MFLRLALLFVAVGFSCPFYAKELVVKEPRVERKQEVDPCSFGVMSLNFQDFNFSPATNLRDDGKMLRESRSEPKSLAKVQEIAHTILLANPDILVGQEIEGIESLKRLNKQFLGDRYDIFMIEGNDDRRIDIGFLVRKGLPLDFELKTHRDIAWVDPTTQETGPLFKRDFPVLLIRKQNDPTRRVRLMVFGVHGKAKRKRPKDKDSLIWRTAEVKGMVEIYKHYEAMYPEAYKMIAGDFNGDLSNVENAPELKPLYEVLNLQNIVQMESDRLKKINPKAPKFPAHTHIWHSSTGPKASQLDGILVDRRMIEQNMLLKARIMGFINQMSGHFYPYAPRSFKEKSRAPTDHLAVYSQFDTSTLFSD